MNTQEKHKLQRLAIVVRPFQLMMFLGEAGGMWGKWNDVPTPGNLSQQAQASTYYIRIEWGWWE